ncbi:hypothetical protein NFI96_000035 [Prochilodus magdalenae]|nr:hypothetical protein NFI96_000035 [Prochilodus magdalenae]
MERSEKRSIRRDCSGVVPDCHGVTHIGSGSSSVTSPAFVVVETPNESVCGGTVVSTKTSGLLSRITSPEGLVSLHLHPYCTICGNCTPLAKTELLLSVTLILRSTMDLGEYFKRIGFTGLYDKADLATLFTVHKLHVMNVPFENLSMHCGERNTMDLKVIYEKIVVDHRGGWCCENNLLFSWVLREMGYKFIMLGAKVFNSVKNEYTPMNAHLINLVEIDGKPYIADVSFGTSSQIWCPLELIADKDQPQPTAVFRLLRDGENWILEKTGRKPQILNENFAHCSLIDKSLKKTMYSFLLKPRNVDHFLETSEYLQDSSESLFTQKSICSLQTPTGFRVLVGWTYSEVTFNPQEDTDLYDIREIPDSEIEALLKEKSTMDLKQYFKRIGFTGLYDKADLATLFTIHELHVMSVPFENLSIHCGERKTMDLEVIYKKIVLDHRGGWCCENNLLFSWVLREMGYKFTMLGAKVFDSFQNEYSPMNTHLINLVEIDGKPYIADVSYGVSFQIWHPLELIADKDQPQPPGVFRLLKDGENWILEKTGRKLLLQNKAFASRNLTDKSLSKAMFSFLLTPRSVDHFLETSEYLQTSSESVYTQKSICSLQTPTGYRALIGWNYSEVTFNPQEDTDLYDIRQIPDSEIEGVLKEKSTMDLREYFKRIGFTGLYDKADLATLCTVHKLHVMNVPFENLSIHCGERNTMDLEVIYKKIVVDHRGGWCCENNQLFSWVLKEMGYKYTMLGAKVFNILKNDFNPIESHLINLVEIDGKPYIADVSYGVSCQIWHPLELIADKDQPQPPGVFRLLKDGERWILEKTGRKPLIQNQAFATCSLVDKRLTKTMYSFLLMQRGVDHFLKTCDFLQTSAESLFTQKSICSLQTTTGFKALVGWTYSEVTFNPQGDTDLYDIREIPDSEIEAVLKEKFQVTLRNKLTPINNKAAYKI